MVRHELQIKTYPQIGGRTPLLQVNTWLCTQTLLNISIEF